jgi:hypothetical protein
MVARGQTMSDGQKKILSDGREAAKERTRIVGFPLGCVVRVNHPVDRQHHGQEGTVGEHNLGEVGVRFTKGGPSIWYRPQDLVRVPKIRGRASAAS